MNLAARRGYFFRSADSYPNVPAGFWDYGPLGVLFRNRYVGLWRRRLVKADEMVEIDTAQILPRAVFVASGHVASFSDPIVECSNCHAIYRADKLIEEKIKHAGARGAAGRRVRRPPGREQDRLQQLQEAADRDEAVQHDVQGGDRAPGGGGVPPPGDLPGDIRRRAVPLQDAAHQAAQGVRAAWEELPERDRAQTGDTSGSGSSTRRRSRCCSTRRGWTCRSSTWRSTTPSTSPRASRSTSPSRSPTPSPPGSSRTS